MNPEELRRFLAQRQQGGAPRNAGDFTSPTIIEDDLRKRSQSAGLRMPDNPSPENMRPFLEELSSNASFGSDRDVDLLNKAYLAYQVKEPAGESFLGPDYAKGAYYQPEPTGLDGIQTDSAFMGRLNPHTTPKAYATMNNLGRLKEDHGIRREAALDGQMADELLPGVEARRKRMKMLGDHLMGTPRR